MAEGGDKTDAILELGRKPWLAHATLFRHRHHDHTPDFHYEIIKDWHSDAPAVEVMAFRGGGKTTVSEEAITTMACFRSFHNGIILGSSYERACERLAAIKNEFETNEFIEELFGDLVGPTWNEGKIVLGNGVVLQAFGRGQSLRGSKHLDRRPDICFGDDLEEEEDVVTPEARAKMLKWFFKVVRPALAPKARIRLAATPLHPESLAMVLSKEPGWVTRRYPIWRVGADGELEALWDARFPLEDIRQLESEFRSLGLMTEFKQEYECEAEDETQKTFTKDMFRIEPMVRTWHAVQGFYDPARTVKTTSAHTGWCYFSWIGHRLVLWDSGGDFWKPDELRDHIFVKDAEYNPIEIGIEKDGLEEFLMQPLRQEMLKRQRFIPIVPYKAPEGKLVFIKGLQPFFKAHEVIFTSAMPALQEQLLGFPTGRIDVPNALAYALRMRPGAPVYDGFSVTNIVEGLDAHPRLPLWLALNATQQWTTAALVQSVDGGLNVLADYVREGDPSSNILHVVASAGMDAKRAYRAIAGPQHFTGHDRVGLRGAAVRVPLELQRGGAHLEGQAEISRLLRMQLRGMPAVKIATTARNTLNALAGGYCRDILPSGLSAEFAKQNAYRVLIEGIESFASLLRVGVGEDDEGKNYARTADGRRYLSARG